MNPKLLLALSLLPGTILAQDQSPFDLDRVQVGQKPPGFTLQASDGRTVSLADFRGKNVVLAFYRGYW